MARFNSPPGWPAFPQGWRPPAGWQPDPRWPRPPANWQWWIVDPPRRGRRWARRASRQAHPVRTAGTARAAATISPPEAGGWLLATSALAVIVGSLMPWVSQGISAIAGTGGDGFITLVLGLLTATGGVMVAIMGRRWAAIAGLALSLAAVAVVAIDTSNIATVAALGVVGPGLWVALLGSVLAMAAAIFAVVATSPRPDRSEDDESDRRSDSPELAFPRERLR